MTIINRIILVGNGFDLAHGLATKYEDFINWYLDEWFNQVKEQSMVNKYGTYSYKLCSFKPKLRGVDTWEIDQWRNEKQFPTGKKFLEYLEKKSELFNLEQASFIKRICRSIETKGWVDIENEYYDALNHEYFEIPEKLNKEFEIIKSELIKYLKNIQESKIEQLTINKKLKEKIFAPIKSREIAIGSLDSEIPNEVIPNQCLLLNFNYTKTADLYFQGLDRATVFINHIHGELTNPDSIIFGYGDELDDGYKDIVKRRNNEHLMNIKSIKYLETPNYRDMLAFIKAAPYQIYIMGHSCGNSDRTLLNTLFEHDNCVSIKPFYYEGEKGYDNYLDLVQNISRNFTDMKLMRNRVVNKTFCDTI